LSEKGYDVETIMEAVNRAVSAPDTLLAEFWREKKPAAPNLAFLYPPHSRSLEVNIDLVSRNWEVDADFPLASKKRFTGLLVVLVKKIVKALTSWYINPIVHQVRKFNMLVTRTLNDVGNNIREMEDRISRLERENEELRASLERLNSSERRDGKGE